LLHGLADCAAENTASASRRFERGPQIDAAPAATGTASTRSLGRWVTECAARDGQPLPRVTFHAKSEAAGFVRRESQMFQVSSETKRNYESVAGSSSASA